jgi:hypothetical protein
MDKTCQCGRVWRLNDQKFIFPEPGIIICKCGEAIHHWSGTRTWYAEELLKGLPEDEGQEMPCRYE